ncbi:L-histidine N(alpha)-methyltransferase [Salinimicrobium tongyeongense]|uniref:L-histidine N(Alpha)-methyltransferase n=1 Tax=Salinimicrobium tongyeongense TaxID=2809707 RepID=A0ABY6NTP4_9FLAO|nr:L-histidine N(alpha)-methyltransferase [Salinimicrobium tongyeongense]UZH56183.1 L-histidine N(alpha)-methyltransferase [Salinimicrobium tongyeongense]
MNNTKPPEFKTQFAEDVFKGLTSYPKKISSKFLYDEKGDELFQQIMELPEYYLTGKEYQILKRHREELGDEFASLEGFDLIELGAGDGKKTKVLLSHFEEKNYDYKYLPVDISKNVLEQLSKSLQQEYPAVEVEPQQGTYAEVLSRLADYRDRKKVILFLGSNIGNLTPEEAVSFLKKISSAMHEKDLFFMGVDQKKEPAVILDAYNDSAKVTEAFNKNLLVRMNRELDAEFDPEDFMHWPLYDPETGVAKSFLVSKKEQTIAINALDLQVHFQKWETIHTEVSQKYDDTSIAWLAREAGLEITGCWADKDSCFKNYLFKRTSS